MKILPIQPIILCGGSGTRLWPLSKENFPKQFLNLSVNNKKSLLQNTLLRIKNIDSILEPILICNEEHRFIVAEQIREIGVKSKSIILEPDGRNTAPAVALGAIQSISNNNDSLLLILSADHHIEDSKKFIEVINTACKYATSGRLVTFGVSPDSPETGFGYIETVEALTNEIKPSSIKSFIEKPNLEVAKKLILDKRYRWNSGIFLFKASQIIDEFNNYEPEIIDLCSKSLKKSYHDLDFLRINKDYFLKCENISIDNAIMEKTELGIAFPLDVGWSDIGSWQTLWMNGTKDKDQNVVIGKVLKKEAKNCYLRSESRLIAALGVEDLIVVENNDSILITKKSFAQKVKFFVQEIEEEGFIEGKSNQKVFRPWGTFTSIANEERWQVKRIEVKPGASLSLQMHHHRSEHWIIVSGTALVEIEDKIELFTENQSVYIPIGCKHRLSNPGKLNLVLIEVQSGAYLGEDDIYRFKDNYGR